MPVRPEVYVPDGWLGALCANLLYVDFTSDDRLFWAAQQHMLLQQIGRHAQPEHIAAPMPSVDSAAESDAGTAAVEATGKPLRRAVTGGSKRENLTLAEWRMRAISAEQRLRELAASMQGSTAASSTAATAGAGMRDKATAAATAATSGSDGAAPGDVLRSLSRIEQRLETIERNSQRGDTCACTIS